MEIGVAVYLVVLVLFTVLPMGGWTVWWIRVGDFPRLQLAVCLLLGLVLGGVFLDFSGWWSWGFMGAGLGCLVYQVKWILPHTRFWKVEVAGFSGGGECGRLRLMNANVLQTNRDVGRLLDLVRANDVDVLCTLESDDWWEEKLIEGLGDDYPHVVKVPLDNLYGMHVFSRLELRDVEVKFLVEEGKPSVHGELVLASGECVRVHFLHPAPPSPTENEESTERDAELLMVADSLKYEERPVVVAGDLNDVAWSRTTRDFRGISGLLDPRVGRGMFNTFHARWWFARWPLDHVFHSGHFEVVEVRRLGDFGSDHLPLLIELVLVGEGAGHDDGVELDEGEKGRAEEMMDEEGVDGDDVPK